MDKAVSFAVCDDDELVCEAICQKIDTFLKESGISVTIDKYVSPVALYKNIKSGKGIYDALFLDIEMPRLSGIELAKVLKKLPRTPDIIFVSNHEDMVFEGFSARPFGFIRKNNFTRDLTATLRAYIKIHIMKNAYIAITQNNTSAVRKLKISDIVYIESFRNKQYLHMAGGEEIECRMSMDDFEKKLGSYDVVRVYKGCLVNLNYIQSIDRTGILLDYNGGTIVNVSREKLQDLKEVYFNYLRRVGTVLFSRGGDGQ